MSNSNQNAENECRDHKGISLTLFGKDTVVVLKENSPSFDNHGKELTGRLVGRILGEKLISIDAGQPIKEETLIAITLKVQESEVTLHCIDIEHFREAN
jgi:hypothetical protein